MDTSSGASNSGSANTAGSSSNTNASATTGSSSVTSNKASGSSRAVIDKEKCVERFIKSMFYDYKKEKNLFNYNIKIIYYRCTISSK